MFEELWFNSLNPKPLNPLNFQTRSAEVPPQSNISLQVPPAFIFIYYLNFIFKKQAEPVKIGATEVEPQPNIFTTLILGWLEFGDEAWRFLTSPFYEPFS